MNIHRILEKHDVRIATIANHNDWVKTKAREIDLDKEMYLAEHFDNISKYFRELYRFAGVSSNNIYWNLTQIPIRIIYIPITIGKYITVINPKILKLEGRDISTIEGCGSVPDNNYIVKRKSFVSLSGYTLDKHYAELEYGSEDYDPGEQPVFASYNNKEWIIQHEMDHLDGVTIKDTGTAFDLNSLMEYNNET